MKRILACLVISAVAVGLVSSPAAALPDNAEVRTYKSGLNFPTDMATVPGSKRIFFTEKNTGKIRILQGRDLLAKACVRLDVDATSEGGALGLVLHPNYKKNHYLYVYWTSNTPHENRVTRFTVQNGECVNRKHIITGIKAHSAYHHGGQLAFAGGKLFISTGDAHDPAAAQNTQGLLGKVLRVNPDGTIPDSNPFGPANPVWTYGHRNPFGLTTKPGTNKVYSTENGPDCDDEVNHIVKGRNYGWGTGYECGSAGEGIDPKPPIHRWSNIVVPTDPWWYSGSFGAMSGALYVGTYGTNALWRFNLNDKGTAVKSRRVVHTAPDGIIDVAKGPGGWLYYMTSSGIRRIVKK